MNVAALLKVKGRAVASVDGAATVKEVAEMLASKRIGAMVLVDKSGGLAGIVSERDIIRALAKNGADALTLPVDKIMTKSVVTCREADTIDILMAKMTAGRFRHLPVVNDQGEMVGLISIGDAVSARLKELSAEKEALTGMIMGN